MITEQQYRRLMKEYQSSGLLGQAAVKAGMHRETARRYVAAQTGPEDLRQPHTWRTRTDPLKEVWPEAERWLEESPEVEAKALFEHLLAGHPGQLDGRGCGRFNGASPIGCAATVRRTRCFSPKITGRVSVSRPTGPVPTSWR